MSGAWKDIWASLKSVVSATASISAFVLAMLGSLWDPGISVRIGILWLAVFGLLAISVVATAIRMTLEARRLATEGLPRVVSVLVSDRKQTITLITRRSRQFGVNTLVTIYYEMRISSERADILEQVIGIGHVTNVQENGLIRILVLRQEAQHASVWQRIRDRDVPVLSDVVVKPFIEFNADCVEVRAQ